MLTQEQRHNMIESFKATNGEETAMALAEGLFSNDLATKEDLKSVKDDVKELRGEFKELSSKVDTQFRWLVGLLVTVLIAVVGTGVLS